jgi:plasmid stability protein
MVNLLIKHLPDPVALGLRARAKAHGCTLQEEIVHILTAVAQLGTVDAAALAEKVRKVVSDAVRDSGERRSGPLRAPASGATSGPDHDGSTRTETHTQSRTEALRTQVVRRRKTQP